MIGGVVLAAGAGRRFGSAKQLASFQGRPLLEHALLAMSGAALVDLRVVVLGANADEILAAVERHGAEPVICPDWDEGQSASLRAAVAALAERVEALVITLGDQPSIDPAAIDRVIGARDGTSDAVRAAYGGRPGHPVLLERALIERVGELRGDQGARRLLDGAAVALVECGDVGADTDIDTPDQLDLSGGGSAPRWQAAGDRPAPSERRSPRP
ncbi:MAG TPA: nucleotidyltransferase family protein [Solirubrobacteraceae bacterium]